MFFKKKNNNISSYSVTGKFDFCNGGIQALREHNSSIANKICFIYDRANLAQKNFLLEVIQPYIDVETTFVTDYTYNDDYGDTTPYAKILSMNIPYDIISQIEDLYNQMKSQNLPTNAERTAQTEEEKRKKYIDDGFKNFFGKQ